MRLERLLIFLGSAAALTAAVWPLASFLGLEAHTLELRLQAPVTIPLDSRFAAIAPAGIFILAGPWRQVPRYRRPALLTAVAALAVLTWFDPGLPFRVAAALPGTLRETAGWLRAFWYGTAEPPAAGPAFLLFTGAAWAYALGLWSVIRGRSAWPLWFAAGSLSPVILWIYDDPAGARSSLLALTGALLLIAPALSAPAGVTRRSGAWLRVAAGVTGTAFVLATAAALPPLEARPMPVLHGGVQRLIPLTARGPGAGFGALGPGSPDRPLTLGGPFRPVDRELLTIQVQAEPDAPVPAALYLRGITRPVYTGSTLEVASPNPLLPFAGREPLPAQVTTLRLEQEIEITGFGSPLIHAAYAVQQIEAPGDLTAYTDGGGTLYFPGVPPRGTRYRVVSEIPQLSPADATALDAPAPPGYPGDDVPGLYLELPPGLPQRVVDLVEQVTAGSSSPYQAARSIEAHLRGFPYHEDTPFTPPGRDFVDYFLFDLQTGYCTYYTAAMVVMLRAVGIPARAVEGFIVSLRGAGVHEVTGAQAHTWVEAYMPGYGWLTFEPTPAYPASPAAPPAPAGSPGSTGEPPAPDLLDPRLGLPDLDLDLDPGIDLLEPGALPSAPEGRPGGRRAALLTATAAALGAAAVGLRRRAAHQAAPPADRIRRIYLRTRRLAVAAALPGAPAPAALTPAELAAVLVSRWPGLAEPLRILTGLYHDAAFGPDGRGPDDAAARQAEKAARSLLRRLRGELGSLRYLAAVLAAVLPGGTVPGRPGAAVPLPAPPLQPR